MSEGIEDQVRYCTSILALTVFFLLTGTAQAAMILDAGVSGMYEDNITASPADSGKDGDFHRSIFVTAGSYRELVEARTYLVLKAGLGASAYDTYDELSSVTGSLSAALYRRHGEVLSSLVTLFGALQDFREAARDGSSTGASVQLTQRLSAAVRLQEAYGFERYHARSDAFSYDGHGPSVWVSIRVTPSMFLGAGYSYVIRRYEEPTGFMSHAHTLSFQYEWTLIRHFYATLRYDRQWYEDDASPGTALNNSYTIGLTYTY